MEPILVHEGRHLNFRIKGHWEYAERRHCHGAAGVVALTDDDHIILISQYRPPIDRECVELPAGIVDPGESEEEAVRRELLEETGYEAASVRKACSGATSAGLSSECMSIFVADGCHRVAEGGGVDDDEAITTWKVPLADLDRWLEDQRRQGREIALTLYAGLRFLAPRPPADPAP